MLTLSPPDDSTISHLRQLSSPWIQKDVSHSNAYKHLEMLLCDFIMSKTPASVLLTGPLRYSLLHQILKQHSLDTNVIRLDGVMHSHHQQHDLVSSLDACIIVLDVFERWSCNPLQQSFLYRLLNGDVKCFVIGVSELMDAVDGLEKRVKSRHSQMVIYACEDVEWEERELMNRQAMAITHFMNGQERREGRGKKNSRSNEHVIQVEQVVELMAQPVYDQDVESLSKECTLNELVVLICIKRLLEKRVAKAFLSSAVYDEYLLLMHSNASLSIMPISRNAFQLGMEGLEERGIIVTSNTNTTAYTFYRLQRITASMIIDIVESRTDVAESVKRICREMHSDSMQEVKESGGVECMKHAE
jgi:hypothetical protein